MNIIIIAEFKDLKLNQVAFETYEIIKGKEKIMSSNNLEIIGLEWNKMVEQIKTWESERMKKYIIRNIIKSWLENGIYFVEAEGLNFIIEVDERDVKAGVIECSL